MNDQNTSKIRVGKSDKTEIIGAKLNNTSPKTDSEINVEEAKDSKITGIDYTQTSEIEELKCEMQKILETLAQNPVTAEATVATGTIQATITSKPTLKQRLQGALKAGGTEALKTIFQHPVVNISVETVKGFLEGN